MIVDYRNGVLTKDGKVLISAKCTDTNPCFECPFGHLDGNYEQKCDLGKHLDDTELCHEKRYYTLDEIRDLVAEAVDIEDKCRAKDEEIEQLQDTLMGISEIVNERLKK